MPPVEAAACEAATSERDKAVVLSRLRRLDSWRGGLVIALDYAVIAATILVAERLHHPLATVAALIVIAGRQVAMLNLVHAAGHAALFPRRRWHQRLEWLYAYPILDAVAIYTPPHLDHHHMIANKTADRFAFLHDELGLPRRGRWGRTWIVFVRPFLGHAAWSFLRSTAKNFVAHRLSALHIASYWLALVLLASGLGVLPQLLLYWVLPLLWLNPVFLLWGEVADHFGTATGTRNHVGPFYALLTNGHALYHDLHHRFAFVPFYDEARAYAALRDMGDRSEMATGVRDFLRAVYVEPRAQA